MKKFIVFSRGSFVDVDKIIAVINCAGQTHVIYDSHSPQEDGYGDEGAFILVDETVAEVRALIEKALGNDVSFTTK